MGADLKARIAAALGQEVVRSAPLGVGFGLEGMNAELADGRRIAVKAGRPRRAGHLLLEATMLRDLKRLSELPVPEVYHADETLLAMEWIDSDCGAVSPGAERHAAELLAALHARAFDTFGYGYDTVIGPLAQPNAESPTWIPFFRDRRLMHMADAARAQGTLPGPVHGRIEALAARLDEFLTEPAHPALIHGDLWGGNVLVKDDRIAGLVDPAIYLAHPEIELAFTTMFSTFGRTFFETYESLLPLEPGFHETRCELYNLYPTLVHLRLFGAGYLGPIETTLRRLGF